ncbi:MAG: PH domain-containing protein [Demequinaceae bacterium]|nr:PH domain-containing protein [Demequinaceae bacterium]
MGQLERGLAPEEKLLINRHTHWKTLIKPVLIALLATAAAVALIYFFELGTIFDIVVAALWAVALVLFLVAPLVRWGTTIFAVTDRRVMYRTGVFNKSGIDIPIARINSVQFRHDFVDRLFGAGTLIIESASDEPLEFNDIPQVEKVHALLYDEVNDALSNEDDNRK